MAKWLILLAFLQLPACSEAPSFSATDLLTDTATDFTGEGSGDLAITNVRVAMNPGNVLSRTLDFDTEVPTAATLSIHCDGELVGEFSSEQDPTRVHSAFVMGLIPNSACTVHISVASDSMQGSYSADFSVDSPPDFLPELPLLDSSDLEEERFTLFNLTNSFDEIPLIVVVVDSKGRYRWYHQRATTDPGSDTDVRTTPQGVLIGGSHGQIMPALISWEGQVVWEKQANMHHDLRYFPDANQYQYLVDVKGCQQEFSSGAIVRIDADTLDPVWEWRICEHYTPAELVSDWSHVNTAAPFGDDDALLVSSRNQNAVFKVWRDSGDLAWKLGEDGAFTLPPNAHFYHQHDPAVLDDGTILMFDNGLVGTRESSRALQLAIDEQNMSAEVVWEYNPSPEIFAPIWGDADRLANGNTLVVFGQRSATKRSRIVEVAPSGNEVWGLVLPEKWGVYRAQRLETLEAGHFSPTKSESKER